jgi:hypothetical protein
MNSISKDGRSKDQDNVNKKMLFAKTIIRSTPYSVKVGTETTYHTEKRKIKRVDRKVAIWDVLAPTGWWEVEGSRQFRRQQKRVVFLLIAQGRDLELDFY